MRARKRMNASLDRGDVVRNVVGAREPHDGLYNGERVLRPVIDLLREQRLALFGLFALRNVHRHAAEARELARRIERRAALHETPAHAAVRPPDAKFDLVVGIVRRQGPDNGLHPLPFAGLEQGRRLRLR